MSRWYGIENHDRMIRQALFVCPRCGLDRDGTEYEPRRWICVLGLPIVPLDAGEHVLCCNVCDHRCDLGVLEIPTTEVLAGYLADATRHGVAAIVRAGMSTAGDVEPAVRRVAVDTMLAEGLRYDDGRLDADVAGLDHTGTVAAFDRLADEMTTYGKQAFLHRLAAVAFASGAISERERSTIVDLGIALRMQAMHINDVLTVADLAAA